jgi:hypothetical protein
MKPRSSIILQKMVRQRQEKHRALQAGNRQELADLEQGRDQHHRALPAEEDVGTRDRMAASLRSCKSWAPPRSRTWAG